VVDGVDPTRVVTRRAAAFFVDALLIALIPLVTVVVVGNVRVRRGDCPNPLPNGRECFHLRENAFVVDSRVFIWFFLLLVVLYLITFVLVQGLTGASPGKALLRIRVIDEDGGHPGFVRSAIRAFAWFVDGLTLLLPVALWLAWFTPGHRRVGDFAARTYVVRHGAVAPHAGSRPVSARTRGTAPGSAP
jgi:uncharacterized RDD family membrane protein YckC